MKSPQRNKADALRERAEELLTNTPVGVDFGDMADLKKLAHELAVHQTELELQNQELRQTYQDLQETKDLFAALYENAPVGYVVLDRVGLILRANNTFSDMVCIESGKLKGTALADHMLDEDAHLFRTRFKSLIRNPEGKAITVRFNGDKGKFKFTQLEFKHIDFKLEKHAKILVTLSDIAALRKAEAALRKSESDYRDLVTNTHDAIIGCDLGGIINLFNPAAENVFKVSASKVLGTNIARFCPEERKAEQQRLFETLLNNGFTPTLETERLTSDGLKIAVEMTVSLRRDENGEPSGASAIVRDITWWKKAQRELEENEKKLASILANMQSMVWSMSWPDMRLLFLTPSVERIYGRPIQDFEANSDLWREMIHPHDQHAAENALNALKENGLSQRKYRIVRPDGRIVWVLDQGHLVYDEAGQPVRVDGVTTDITEIQILRGLLPICSNCKKIRNDKGYWEHLEAYFNQYGGAEFTHSICPDCIRELYPELDLSDDNNDL
jgi:PAS domain S-box-containing protein